MDNMYFKATRKKSSTYWEYRQIEKRWDKSIDLAWYADDVIIINLTDLKWMLHIDCDKVTWEFRLFLSGNEV